MKRKKIRNYGIVLLAIMALLGGCGNEQAEKPKQNTDAEVFTETEEITETEFVTDSDAEATDIILSDHSECVLESVTQTETGCFLAVYDGIEHECIMDLPQDADNAPLVVMLHGYGESAEGFKQKIGFEQYGVDSGYAVVYVTGAADSKDATSSAGWNSGIGMSENRDVDFLCALVNHLCANYSLDKNRVYAVGFSNGAFMTHRLALEANDTFAAVVSVAGMMPKSIWDGRNDTCNIGVFQITGEKDDVVPQLSDGSAKHSKAPAIEDVVSYYAEADGLTLTKTENVGKKSVLDIYTSQDSGKQVWNLFIPDGRHSWPDEKIVGFDINQMIIDFLETQ